MNILHLTVSSPGLTLSPLGVDFDPFPPNLRWEWTEVAALASRVHWVTTDQQGSHVSREIDVIFASTGSMVERGHYAARSSGKPWVCRVIEAPGGDVERQMISYLQTASGIVYPSEWLLDAWSGRRPAHVPTYVVPHGLAPPVGKEPHPSHLRPPGVLFIGWLVPRKRVDVLIRACAEARVPLVIVGDGPERSTLESLVSELRSEVLFTGLISDAYKAALLRRARIYASAADEEYWCLPIGEAMTYGCRVIHRDLLPLRCVWGDEVEWFTSDEALPGLLKQKRRVGTSGRQHLIDRQYFAPRAADVLATVLASCVDRTRSHAVP